VSAPTLCLPEEVWVRIAEFLVARRTGQVTLNVSQGTVTSADLREYVRAGEQRPGWVLAVDVDPKLPDGSNALR